MPRADQARAASSKASTPLSPKPCSARMTARVSPAAGQWCSGRASVGSGPEVRAQAARRRTKLRRMRRISGRVGAPGAAARGGAALDHAVDIARECRQPRTPSEESSARGARAPAAAAARGVGGGGAGMLADGTFGRDIVDTDDALGWLERRPEITSLRAAVCDLNGMLRGKRVPVVQMPKVLEGSMRMPYSITCLDIWGEDVKGNPLVFQQGDIDGRCEHTGRGFLPINWLGSPTALLPLWIAERRRHPLSRRPAAGAGGGLRALRGPRADPGDGDRTRVLPGRHHGRGADAAALAGVAQVPRRRRRALDRRPRSLRGLLHRRLRRLRRARRAGRQRHRRERRRAVRDQPAARAGSAEGGRRRLVFQADRPRHRAQVRLRRHFHGQALPRPGRQRLPRAFQPARPGRQQRLRRRHRRRVRDHAPRGRRAAGADAGVDPPLRAAPELLPAAAPNAHVASEVCWGYENRTAAIRIPGGSRRGAAHRAPGRGRGRQPLPGAGGDPRGGARGDRGADRAAGADAGRRRGRSPSTGSRRSTASSSSEAIAKIFAPSLRDASSG